ncbi:class I SAM-dependent methyltransferase [Phragmitibacter flavus]|nr:SAM-dependent methyltransferase [Phragmitibacter flavus]
MIGPEWLLERLRLSPDGRLPWVEVMDQALYAPGVGYYRRGVRRIGRSGDFYTSVSVGGLYGELLAVFSKGIWVEMECPTEFLVVEQGAHDGQLMRDFLEGARREDAEFFEVLRVVLVEPDGELRRAQQENIGDLAGDRVRWVEDWSEIRGQGLIFCNELLDAFAVHWLKRVGKGWRELWVEEEEKFGGGLVFVEGELSTQALAMEAALLEGDFAEGQLIEVNVAMVQWLREVSGSGFEGVMLVADYGLPERELLAAERMEGTLRRYMGHRSDGRVLEDLGECDLTSHVNFTRLASEGLALGWRVVEFVEQGRFLTRVASAKMGEPGFVASASWVRQFQMLTHPHHLGQSFHVLALAKGALGAEVCASLDSDAALRRLGLGDQM